MYAWEKPNCASFARRQRRRQAGAAAAAAGSDDQRAATGQVAAHWQKTAVPQTWWSQEPGSISTVLKTDPWDGQESTYVCLLEKYAAKYSPEEICDYWNRECGLPKSTQEVAVSGICVSSLTSAHEVIVQTLIGDYVEMGAHHGKKSYRKMQQIKGFEHISIFLYFWGECHGSSVSGWWFGDQVGGNNVWARSASNSMIPPRNGWYVPWDDKIAKPVQLLVELSTQQGAPTGQQASQSVPALNQVQKLVGAQKLEEAIKEMLVRHNPAQLRELDSFMLKHHSNSARMALFVALVEKHENFSLGSVCDALQELRELRGRRNRSQPRSWQAAARSSCTAQ